MDLHDGMFQTYLNQKDHQLMEQEAKYKALQEEYYRVVNSSFWRYTQWIRDLINTLRGAARRPAARTTTQTTVGKPPEMDTRVSPEEMAAAMKTYDIVSFDVFDTLILRNCEEAEDVFSLIALQCGCESFARLRVEAEAKVREKSEGTEREITLSEIYDELCKWIRLDKEKAMQAEIDMELALCVPNPYMKRVFDTMRAWGKTIIVVTDMYLPRKVIELLLQRCGYFGYSELYVSNQVRKSKATGSLYEHINTIHPECSVVHTGDNYQSDVLNAHRHGWSTYYYPSVKSMAGGRLQKCESPVGSLYAGLCGNRLFADTCDHSPGYRHGYACGGLMSVGYCRWLERFARENKADKILFLARDSEIFDVIYKRHIHSIETKYMVVSRFSMWQIVFDLHTEEYIRFFFWNRALAENTLIGDAFSETGLDFLTEMHEAYDLTADTILDRKNYEVVREMIYDKRERISEQLKPMRAAAGKYFAECFGDGTVCRTSGCGFIRMAIRKSTRICLSIFHPCR